MKINKNLADIYRKDTIQKSKQLKEYIAWFDSFRINPLSYYFTQQDITFLNRLAISPYMHCNIKEMYEIVGNLMKDRGFKLIGGGTNRRAYVCTYDERIVAKIATDHVGFTSNLREGINQNVLKPFCNKIFNVSPYGELSLIETLVPIKDDSEFQKYAQEIFDILYFMIRNNSIAMDDIGTRSKKNWGYRVGFGPALLDFPSMYVADPKKRLCKGILNGRLCSGTLDYDEGFNNIVCSECGKTYLASTLSKPDGDNINSLLSAVGYKKEEGVKKMKVIISSAKTGEVLYTKKSGATSNHVDPTTANLNGNIYGVFDNTKPAPTEKKRKVIITPVNNNEEVVESKPAETIVPESTTTMIIDEKNKFKYEECNDFTNINSHSAYLDQMVLYASKRKGQKANDALEEKRRDFMKTVSLMNTNIPVEQVSDINKVSPTDLINAINNMIITDNPFMSEEEAMDLYKSIQSATLNPNDSQIVLNVLNIRVADTMLNKMLRKISGGGPSDDMFIVFYKLILNVKNTKIFIESIVNFWTTLLEMNSFDMDTSGEVYTFCVYKEIYNIYRDAVDKALEDYRYNITLSGNFSYNASNVMQFINFGVSQMNFYVDSENAFTSDIDLSTWYEINLSENYSEIISIEALSETEEVKEDDTVDSNDSVEATNTETEESLNPVDLYEKYVSGSEKQGTNKQQNRYDGKKNKKKNKKHRK